MITATEHLVKQIVSARTRLGEVLTIHDIEAIKKQNTYSIMRETQFLKEALALHMTVGQFDMMYEAFARERDRAERLDTQEDDDL